MCIVFGKKKRFFFDGKGLKKTDRKLVLAAHNRNYEKKKIMEDVYFWDDCAREGYLDLLIYGDEMFYQKKNHNRLNYQRRT